MAPANAEAEVVHGVLVTYRRPIDLEVMLQRLADQTKRLDTLVVVDNAADPRTDALVAAHPDAAGRIETIACEENGGPAGALAVGIERVLGTAGDGDWVMLIDDDDPPRTTDVVAFLASFGRDMCGADPQLGGVGIAGDSFDVRRGHNVRILDDELRGPVAVDSVGGNQFPFLRVEALRAVGVPDPRLFWGKDDLEFGLRLNRAQRRLYANGERWHEERAVLGRLGITTVFTRDLAPAGWRDYYNTRNLIWILRQHGSRWGAVRVVARRLAKALYHAPRHPRVALGHIASTLRAAFDGSTGRLGRRVEPTPKV